MADSGIIDRMLAYQACKIEDLEGCEDLHQDLKGKLRETGNV